MTEIPEKIYLQWDYGDPGWETTWCVDKINDDDLEYVSDERGYAVVMNIMQKIIDAGWFPGIGYDAEGWEAWAFSEPPIEGNLLWIGEYEKAIGQSPLEAINTLWAIVGGNE